MKWCLLEELGLITPTKSSLHLANGLDSRTRYNGMLDNFPLPATVWQYDKSWHIGGYLGTSTTNSNQHAVFGEPKHFLVRGQFCLPSCEILQGFYGLLLFLSITGTNHGNSSCREPHLWLWIWPPYTLKLSSGMETNLGGYSPEVMYRTTSVYQD